MFHKQWKQIVVIHPLNMYLLPVLGPWHRKRVTRMSTHPMVGVDRVAGALPSWDTRPLPALW